MVCRLHPLEMRPIAGYARRVHAGAFTCAVETVMSFDKVDAGEATRRLMAELDSGALRLKVEDGHAAYCYAADKRR